MTFLTSQQILQYYEWYGSIDVTFTKEINDSLGLIRNQIFLKHKNGQRPCIIYSSSMKEAKIVVGLNEELKKHIEQQNLVSLRFCFRGDNKEEAVSFFVQGRITELMLYDRANQLHFAPLKFIQRPPDNLIEILGGLLESNINASRRSEERILIENKSIRHLGLESKFGIVRTGKTVRNGIIRDLSFGAARIIFLCEKPKKLMHHMMTLRIPMLNGNYITLKGRPIRFERMDGHEHMLSLSIRYTPESVPYEYKLMINNYLKQKDGFNREHKGNRT